MSTHTTPRRRLGLFAVTALALASLGVVALSSALFTDQEVVPNNTFSTGTVDLTTTPTSAVVTFSAMAPGDKVTAPLTVANAGTLDFRYSIAGSATNGDSKDLRSALELVIKTGVTACTNAGFAADGTAIYTGDLDGTLGKIVGDVAQGSQSGDRDLAASDSEVLCFQAALPIAADDSVQGATTTATFTFDAEQTKNN